MRKIVEIKAGDPIPKNGIYRGTFERKECTGQYDDPMGGGNLYGIIRYYFYEVTTKVKKR